MHLFETGRWPSIADRDDLARVIAQILDAGPEFDARFYQTENLVGGFACQGDIVRLISPAPCPCAIALGMIREKTAGVRTQAYVQERTSVEHLLDRHCFPIGNPNRRFCALVPRKGRRA